MKNLRSPPLNAALIEAIAVATSPHEPTAEATARMHTKLFQRIHEHSPEYIFIHSHEGEWTHLLRGVELKRLRQEGSQHSYLLRMKPGSRIPPHEHKFDEESLVLEGNVTIDGVLCCSGDYHFAPRGKPHGWLVSEAGCLLFVRGGIESHPDF